MLSKVDHTLLKPEATWPQIQTLCDEAVANHCASVCINTCYVKQAVEYMAGRVPVCCVVGFPLGAMDTASKAFEARTAVENGASEVDMVINIGWLKNKQYDDVRNDIAAVKAAVGDKILKVIIETCLLTEEENVNTGTPPHFRSGNLCQAVPIGCSSGGMQHPEAGHRSTQMRQA